MFVIVKYAAKEHENQWGNNKPSDGVFANHSIHETHVGKSLGIKPYYLKKEDAEKDLAQAIEANPTVGYAVCPVVSFWSPAVEEIFLSALHSMRPVAPTMKVYVCDEHRGIVEGVVTGFFMRFVGSAQGNIMKLTDIDISLTSETLLFSKVLRSYYDNALYRVFALSIDF